MWDTSRVATRALAGVWLVVALAVPAAAQRPIADPPTSAEFFSRYDFHLSAAALAPTDPRFLWDTHWGGDFDLVDYVRGRLSFAADYQTLLGNQLQPFDPRQSTYVLEVSSSARIGSTEVAGVLHHVSRHLGDRAKEFGIAWNVVGVRALRQFTAETVTVDLRTELGAVTERAFVDYLWSAKVDLVLERPVSQRLGVYGRLYSEMYGVDGAVAGRSAQWGGRGEAGVLLIGTGGVLELFGGVERVVDADPIDRLPRTWAFAGFRLVAP